jgi:hypothetical protein
LLINTQEPSGVMISSIGGLDLISTIPELTKVPGVATQLINFESGLSSGYRRVNGYTKFGTTQVNGTAHKISGVASYADGVVACVDNDVYFSTDGITWLAINYDTWNGGSGQSDSDNGDYLIREHAVKYTFHVYSGNTEYGELLILDGVNPMGYFKITGINTSRKYYYREITTVTYGAPAAPRWIESYKEHIILGGDASNLETVYWSDAFDPVTFTGGTSGSIKILDKINGIKVWRDRLFIFGKTSISEIIDINAPATIALNNVSHNVGCLSGYSLQEFGGDLIWLAVDGIRTLSGTDKIDDIGLSSVSGKIAPLIQELVSYIDLYNISSIVIRNKNQYRLFYNAPNIERGFIGTYKLSPTGLVWEWGELLSFPVMCTNSTIQQSLLFHSEVLLHGGNNGYVYLHDEGDTFDGNVIEAIYSTPELDFGDIGKRKTIQWLDLFLKIEGGNESLIMSLQFDFNSDLFHQPPPYPVLVLTSVSLYGIAIYGVSTYGGLEKLAQRVRVEGSGYSARITFSTFENTASITVSGFYIRYYQGKYL